MHWSCCRSNKRAQDNLCRQAPGAENKPSSPHAKITCWQKGLSDMAAGAYPLWHNSGTHNSQPLNPAKDMAQLTSSPGIASGAHVCVLDKHTSKTAAHPCNSPGTKLRGRKRTRRIFALKAHDRSIAPTAHHVPSLLGCTLPPTPLQDAAERTIRQTIEWETSNIPNLQMCAAHKKACKP